MDQLVQLRRLQLHIEQLVCSWSSSCALGRAVLPELGCAAPVLGAPVLASVPLLRPGQLWKLRDGVLHHDDFLKTRLARKLSKREFTKWKSVPYFTPLFNNTLGMFLVYHSFGFRLYYCDTTKYCPEPVPSVLYFPSTFLRHIGLFATSPSTSSNLTWVTLLKTVNQPTHTTLNTNLHVKLNFFAERNTIKEYTCDSPTPDLSMPPSLQ